MTARFEAEPNVSNHFAWVRTRLGLERTYLAWLRTAVSLIGFGFTIVQFFARLQKTPGIGGREMRPQEPRDLGLALIATGIGVLVISSWQYLSLQSYLRGQFREIAPAPADRRRSPALFAGAVLGLIGIGAFVSVFYHFL